VSGKLLVVDDDPAICELLGAILASAGLRADTIADSTRAAARLRTEKFDAIFLDVRMPSPDGIELTRELRASGYNQNTPIIMITGEKDPAVLTRCFQAGANFFLFKPIDRRRLLRVVRAAEGSIQREKRRYQRVKVRCQVSAESENQRLEGTTVDLSLNGFLMQAERVLPVGSRMEIQLRCRPQDAPVRAHGRVVRLIGTDCMGVQLDRMSPKDSERLQEFLLPQILAMVD
jgi:CheY-like chemotaxis protein